MSRLGLSRNLARLKPDGGDDWGGRRDACEGAG